MSGNFSSMEVRGGEEGGTLQSQSNRLQRMFIWSPPERMVV